jgi:hypothetical protein
MRALFKKTNQLLSHTIIDKNPENITTYTWPSMWSRHNCPCCSYVLLRHVRLSGIYWRCSHCYQEMPVLDMSKYITTSIYNLAN